MALLFDCSADNVSLHLKNIYKEEELLESATSEDFSEVHSKEINCINRQLYRRERADLVIKKE